MWHTKHLLKLGNNGTKTASCHHQLHIRSYSGPPLIPPYTSSIEKSNWHHHWCHSDGHICQIIHLLSTRQCAGNTREIKEDKISPYFNRSKETLRNLHFLSIWSPWLWGAHAPESDFLLTDNQLGMPILTSAQLFPQSHESDHSQRHLPLSMRIVYSILQGNLLLLRISLHQNIPWLDTTMHWI